jgi:hypothetical protein
MSTYSFKDTSTSTDRHKLYVVMCKPEEISVSVSFIQTQNITPVNIGKELAGFLDELEDYSYLNIEVFDFTKKLLDNKKVKLTASGNNVIAIYNLGILLEPDLRLNAVNLLKDFSKSTSVIIIWENQSEQPDRLNWATQKHNYHLDFSDTQLKKLQYAI